jgi:insulysin
LDQIQQHVEENFSKVKNKNYGQISHQNLPLAYTEKQLKKIIRFKSSKKTKKICFNFILPSFKSQFRSNPLYILSHLVGHESKGSILSKLIYEKLALALTSYKEHYSDYFTSFSINIQCTDKGFENYQEIIKIVFRYFRMLKSQTLPKYIFDEIQTILNLSFEFKSKSSGMNKAIAVTESLGDYPPELINKVNYMMESYDSEKFAETLKYFTIDNLVIELRSPEFKTLDHVEEIYKIIYSTNDIPNDLISEVNDILDLNKKLEEGRKN